MKPVCADGIMTKGYDVSDYQPNFDHLKMKLEGNEFCFIKSSEGTHNTASWFERHRIRAKSAGLLVGAYHFYHPSQDPQMQAAHMAGIVGKLMPGDLGPVMDWETTDGMPSSVDREQGLMFLSHLEALTGRTPIIYTGPYFASALGLDTRFLRFPLWVAHYTTKCPLVPDPWSKWTFWQHSGTGVDLDYFNGTADSLRALAQV